MPKFLGFIPARQGSKRIKNKNLRLYKRKPLIYYSINASIKSRYISNTIVFSNSVKINLLAESLGAITSCKRPESISGDKISMFSTISYFIRHYSKKFHFDYLVLLQPCSPLRNYKDVNKACRIILKNKNADGLLSTFFIRKIKKNYPNKFMIEKNNFLKKIDASKIQSDSKLFLRNGPAIFIIKSSSIKKNLYNCNLLNFRMTEKKSIDINTENDLKKLRKYK